jgi:hypothetical protein
LTLSALIVDFVLPAYPVGVVSPIRVVGITCHVGLSVGRDGHKPSRPMFELRCLGRGHTLVPPGSWAGNPCHNRRSTIRHRRPLGCGDVTRCSARSPM